jgi:hypothetical protein
MLERIDVLRNTVEPEPQCPEAANATANGMLSDAQRNLTLIQIAAERLNEIMQKLGI